MTREYCTPCTQRRSMQRGSTLAYRRALLLALLCLCSGCSGSPESLGRDYAAAVCQCYQQAPLEDFTQAVDSCQRAVDQRYRARLDAMEADPEQLRVLRKVVVEAMLACDKELQQQGR